MNYKQLVLLIFLTSCIGPLDKGEISLNLSPEVVEKHKESKLELPSISNVTLVNDQLTVSGLNFSNLSSVKINSQNLSVLSNDGSTLVLSAPSAVMLALNTALNLVVETAAGAASVSVTFNLVDGSVTASKIGDGEVGANHLSGMGAGVGQVMQWNGTTWVPTDLSGLTYLGSWDATLTGVGPDAGGGSSAGEYYVVSNPGTVDVDGISSWAAGDWVVWNGTTWDKIDNSTGVTSFNGRTGTVTPQTNDYTWAQIDKTTSSIGDLSDVDMSGVAANKILKWDGAKWAISDDLSSGGAGSVSSAEIQDGTIQASDLNAGLNTTLTQVGTNTTDIATNTSDISTNAGNITTNTSSISTNSTNIASNASNISTNSSVISTNTTNIASNTTALGNKVDKTTTVNGQALSSNVTLTTSNVGEGTNLYYTAARAKADAILNSTAGSETDQAASVAAMKSYVLAQTGAITGSQWTTSGSDIYYNSGKVGIGSTTPQGELDVQGDVFFGVGSNMGRLKSMGNDTYLDAIPVSSNIVFRNNGAVEKMRISSNGNVGIGTTSPQSLLHVSAPSGNGVLTLTGASTSNQGIIDFGDSSTRSQIRGGYAAGGGGSITFMTDTTGGTPIDRMYIGNDGDVGIGTTSPTSKLHVVGDSKLEGSVTLGSTGSVIKYVDAVSNFFLPAQGTRAKFLNVGASSLCRVYVVTGENGYRQSTELVISRQTLPAPIIVRKGLKTHDHSFDVSFSSDTNGDIWAEKFLYSTTRDFKVVRVEAENGTCTPYDGTITDTGVGADQSRVEGSHFVKNGNDVYYTGGNVGIGTSTPNQKLVIGNDIGAISGNIAAVIGSDGSSGSMNTQFFMGNDSDNFANFFWNAADRDIIFRVKNTGTLNSNQLVLDSSGKVGVGTNSPTEKLDVSGNVKATAFYGDGSNLTGISASNSSNAGDVIIAADSDANASGAINFNTAGTTKMSLTNNGSLGIGTTSPISKLQVVDGVIRSDLTGNGNAAILSGSGTNLHFNMGEHLPGYSTFQNTSSDTASNGFHFKSANNDLMVIRGDGNVGIGTNAPTAKLDISSAGNSLTDYTARFQNSPSVDGAGGVLFDQGSTYSYKIHTATTSSSAGSMKFSYIDQATGAPVYDNNLVLQNGNVGIGASIPGGDLHIKGDTGGQADIILEDPLGSKTQIAGGTYGSAGSSKITFRTQTGGGALTSRMLIDDVGNVGIGTTSPTVKLDVAGDIKATNISATSVTATTLGMTNIVTNYLPYFNGTILDDSPLYNSSGKIGLGMTTPREKLDVDGVVVAGDGSATSGSLQFAGNYSGGYLNTYGSQYSSGATAIGYAVKQKTGSAGFVSSAGGVGLSRGAIVLDDEFVFSNSGASTTAVGTDIAMTPRFKVEKSGKVGIGTDSPASTLHVESASPVIILRDNANLETDNAFQSYISGQDSTGLESWWLGEGTPTGKLVSLYAPRPGYEVFMGNSSGGVRVDTSGNVGIGTTTPSTDLHVVTSETGIGGTLFESTYSAPGATFSSILTMRRTNAVGSGTGVGFALQNASSSRHEYGYIGAIIEDNTAGSEDGGLLFATDVNGISRKEHMRIASSGNVGIGTNSPTSKLHVSGGRIVAGEAIASTSTAMVVGNTSSNSEFMVGQSDSNRLSLGWVYNATPANAYASIGVIGGNDLALQGSGGNVGIGTTSPVDKLHLGGADKRDITIAPGTTSQNINFIHSDNGNTNARYANITGVLSNGGTGYNYGHIAISTGPNTAGNPATVERMRVTGDGNVGIGTTTPSYKLQVNGTVAGSAAYVNTSDERFKNNIRPIESALEKIKKLDGVEFVWRTEEFKKRNFKEGNDIGVIAQNILEVFPEAVEQDHEGYYSVAYAKLVAPLIQATKELDYNLEMYKMMNQGLVEKVEVNSREIASLKEKVEELELKNQEMKEVLCEIRPTASFCR